MLDPFGRGAIIALSALCVAGVFAFAPIRGRSSSADVQLRLLPQVAESAGERIAILPVRRDPFAQPHAPATVPTAPAELPPPGTLGTLPANISGDPIPAIPNQTSDALAAPSRITAIVTGAHPYAMLETAGVHEIKTIGDPVAGSAIVSIDLAGIRLQNGAHLALTSAGSPR
jgi:hypothetical protein